MQKFTTWQRAREAVPTIVALRRASRPSAGPSWNGWRAKLAALPPDARARLDEVTRLLVEKLLLQPTEQLKNAGDAHLVAQYTYALSRLFGLSMVGDEEEKGAAGREGRQDPL